MYQHFHDPLTFRLSAWPWGGQSYGSVYNYRIHNILFKPILDYLAQELDKSPTLKVRATTFTLVNVYSGFTDMSYGSSPAPHPRVRRGPLVFTFAMTRRDPLNAPPRHIIWNTGMTALWGPKLQFSHDLLSISVPINIAAQCRMNNTLRRQLEWLFKIVGGWSKSYAMRREPIAHRTDDVKLIHDQLYFRGIPRMMWMFPWEDWRYAREFWDRAPDVLQLDELDNTFITYFLRYLTRYFDNVDDPNAKQAFRFIEDEVHAGVLDLVQSQITSKSALVDPFVSTRVKKQIADNQPVAVESLVRAICTGGDYE